jgi:hypothetical protein
MHTPDKGNDGGIGKRSPGVWWMGKDYEWVGSGKVVAGFDDV